jgi:20S proteasome subunit beta 6
MTIDMGIEEASDIVKDALHSAGERDIYTGDYLQMVTITTKGVSIEQSELKFD